MNMFDAFTFINATESVNVVPEWEACERYEFCEPYHKKSAHKGFVRFLLSVIM